MTNLLTRRRAKPDSERGLYQAITGDTRFTYNGTQLVPLPTTMATRKTEPPANDFLGYVYGIYKSDGVVYSVSAARQLLLSETRFCFRNRLTRKLYTTGALGLLERPWTNGTTGELLRRMDQDATLAGNSYYVLHNGQMKRLNPGKVDIILHSDRNPEDPAFQYDAEIAGYMYRAGSGYGDVQLFVPDEVMHYSPDPDPEVQFRGMSWLTPVIREITSDISVNAHKQAFFDNAATPNLVVKFPEGIATKEQFEPIVEAMESTHSGTDNAYKTLYLMAGADATVVGASASIDFKSLQGTYETRICMAGRVPAVIAGSSEGMQGSSLNAGNFGQARRMMADGWYHPTVKDAASCLGKFVAVPDDSELWYDPSDVAFLREDEKDAAEIQNLEAQTIRSLLDAGYLPDSVVAAVTNGDFTQLKHSGLFSVQLQEPGASAPPDPQVDKPDGNLP